MSVKEYQTALSHWKGRPYVLRELERRGFALHKHYDQIIADECPVGDASELEVYWNEMAQEYICSGGQAQSRARVFPDMDCYRSEYLDNLAFRQREEPAYRKAIHPCVLAFELRRTRGGLREVYERLEALKSQEILHHEIRHDSWTGSGSDLPLIFHRLMTGRGFEKRRRSYLKMHESGLIFEGRIDRGGKPYVTSVPFKFSITHQKSEDKEEVFELWVRRVVEGLDVYSSFRSAESAVLGFKAYAEIFDIISGSFSTEVS